MDTEYIFDLECLEDYIEDEDENGHIDYGDEEF